MLLNARARTPYPVTGKTTIRSQPSISAQTATPRRGHNIDLLHTCLQKLRHGFVTPLLITILTMPLWSGANLASTAAPEPAAASQSAGVLQDFENQIAKRLLAQLEKEFAQTSGTNLDLQYSAVNSANDKLGILNYYQPQIASIDQRLLNPGNQLRLQLLEYARLMLQQQVRFGRTDKALSPYHGPHLDLLQLLFGFTIEPDRGVETLLAETARLGNSLRQPWQLQAGLSTAECESIRIDIARVLQPGFLASVLAERLHQAGIPAEARTSNLDAVQESLQEAIFPALANLQKSMDCSAVNLTVAADPAYYQYRLRRFSANSLTAEAVHDLGLAAVAELRQAITTEWQQRQPDLAVSSATVFDKIRAARVALEPDEATRQQYLSAMAEQVAASSNALAPWLATLQLPDLDIVATSPQLGATSMAFAYLQESQQDQAATARVVVNFDTASAPNHEELIAQTAYHTIPGLHLVHHQPNKLSGLMGQAEDPAHFGGWALYLTNLVFADEPSARLGILTLNAQLAAMLVIDTGIHQLGWQRQQAIDYLLANTAVTTTGAARLVDQVRFSPAAMMAPYLGLLAIKNLPADTSWQALLAAGPVPAPLYPEVLAWLTAGH
jgi:uncharacterized protein (DUF885 family)